MCTRSNIPICHSLHYYYLDALVTITYYQEKSLPSISLRIHHLFFIVPCVGTRDQMRVFVISSMHQTHYFITEDVCSDVRACHLENIGDGLSVQDRQTYKSLA